MSPNHPHKDELLDAMLRHVPFDGWTESAFTAAAAEIGMTDAEARGLCPRGAVDLARAFHLRGDAAMELALAQADLSDMRFRDKVAHALWLRIEAMGDREAVRRGTVLFAQPHMAADGAQLVWGTADAIWEALGDPSDDFNWYSKRATLSAVWTAVVLFWLGDDSPDRQATRAFIDRRIDDVMRIEKIKAQVAANPLLSRLTSPLSWAASHVKAPARVPRVDLPGSWTRP